MSTALRSLLVIILGVFLCGGVSAQEEKLFNSYVLRAYEVMRENQTAKYDKASYFTRNLDYGKAAKADLLLTPAGGGVPNLRFDGQSTD